ncbi:TRAP transporter substrate-binding protein DctP [Ruegeria litorea]|uniref:TRAP transporter substrate-binding protein DctP n=1 Tax=Falsiruegeria litorea TaxID=1280831 RepID=A0ABS5WKI2_9RHOB|nr:TRAP transporter substrate-binding protein DctP [Falsiruegeria litorea]MBT3139487.1 TRAP transporter substrate-binding protein DctP [Falsiruegeria litorea]
MSFNLKTTFAGLAFLAASSAPALAADVTLKLAGTLPEAHQSNRVLEDMIAEIEGADVGISIQFFPAGQLGSGEELLDDAKFGNVDMVHASVYAVADPRIDFQSLPFLAGSIEDIREITGNPDAEYNKIFAEILEQHGIMHLSTIIEGLVGAVSTKMPDNPRGLGDQGTTLRVWSSQLAKSTLEVLGYQTVTMAWAEAFPAVQAGTVDGAMCCTPELALTAFAASDVGSVYIDYAAFNENQLIYMNMGKFQQLSDEQMAVVMKAARTAGKRMSDEAYDRTASVVEQLREKNWEIVEFTPEERAAIKETVVAQVWPSVADVVGQDILDRLSK